MLPLNDDILKSGFFWREFEVTVDVGPRIRLPRFVIKILKDHKVKELWCFVDPTGPRMIICPSQNRQTYIKVAEQNFPALMEAEEAFRKFICTGKQVTLSNQGQVSIPSVCNRYLKIEAGQEIVLIGVGNWYELWRQDDWRASEKDVIEK